MYYKRFDLHFFSCHLFIQVAGYSDLYFGKVIQRFGMGGWVLFVTVLYLKVSCIFDVGDTHISYRNDVLKNCTS